MKALIRGEEIYPENEWSDFTRNHLTWHATANPDGDGYALCGDCPEDAKPEDFTIEEHKKIIEDDKTIVVLVAVYHG